MGSSKTPLRTEILIEILGIIVLIAFFGSQLNLLRDPGVGWHLRTGEWIAHSHAIPSADPFLFTSAGKRWICNQWFSDLLFWGIYSVGGLGTVEVATFLICFLPFLWLIPARLRHYGASSPVLSLTLLTCMGLGLVQWYVRPVIFSFLLFAVVYQLLWKRCQLVSWSNRDFVIFPLIFLLWANLHPGFPLGFALLAFAVLDAAVRLGVRSTTTARILGVLALSILATVINPYGLELHRAIFGLISSDYFMGLNTEWQSPNFHNPVFWPLVFTLFLCLTAPKHEPGLLPFEKVTFGLFAVLGLMGARYVPFLGVAAATPLVCALQGYFGLLVRFRRFTPVTAFLDAAAPAPFRVAIPTTVLGLILLVTTIAGQKIPGWKPDALSLETKFPAQAMEILRAASEGARVFHTPNWGGFFTWNLWPHQKAFIDDRNELNGKEIYEDYFSIAHLKPVWRSTIEKYQFNFLLLERDSPIYTAAKSAAEWKLRFEDEKSALFERGSAATASAP